MIYQFGENIFLKNVKKWRLWCICVDLPWPENKIFA
jgi:hypothetical protein